MKKKSKVKPKSKPKVKPKVKLKAKKKPAARQTGAAHETEIESAGVAAADTVMQVHPRRDVSVSRFEETADSEDVADAAADAEDQQAESTPS